MTKAPSRSGEHVIDIDTDRSVKTLQLADSREMVRVAGKSRPVPMFCPIHMRVINERAKVMIAAARTTRSPPRWSLIDCAV